MTTRDTPFDDREARFSAGRLGMSIFLVSLGVLFGASVIGYLVVSLQTGQRPPGGLPPLPRLLWLSTAVLIASSGTIQWALLSARKGREGALGAAMLITTGLALTFLTSQSICWAQWTSGLADLWSRSEEYRYLLTGFYVLTGIHAAHVVGGLVPMIIVTAHAMGNRYSADSHAAVQYITMYWHFLDAVWLVLFAVLLIGA